MIFHFKYKLVRSFVIWAVLALIAGSCSTQRNTWINRNFHQINTLYNGLFNARESYQSGLEVLENAHVDNFDAPLSIFQYGTPDQRQSVAQNMEIAYQKAARVIGRHSMFIRNVEHNRLIDDVYFVIARSQFFRGKYAQSLATFQYISRAFQSPLAKQSLVWQAKVLAHTGNNTEASRILMLAADKLAQADMVDTEASRLYHLVMADLAVRLDNLSNAAVHIQKAIELTRSRKDRARLTFILGQYYQVLGQPARASLQFEKVLLMPSGFELAFHARLGLAYNSIAAGGNPHGFQDELHRMLRQGRYRIYHGRIHYALAIMSLEINDTIAALTQFREAARKSANDRSQKGKAYYHMGKLYFARGDFIHASNYYDSALVHIPMGMEDREQILRLQAPLRQIAANLNIIQREDSLQNLARLSEAERNRIVDGIVDQMQQSEMANLPGGRPAMALEQRAQLFAQGTPQEGAEWYFYNPIAIRFGKEEFERRFGQRELEDFWRLSNREATTDEFVDHMQPLPDEELITDQSTEIFSALLANIPLTREQIAESNFKIANAYFDLGIIFKDQLNDLKNAAEAFQKLADRRITTENTPVAFFHLVRIHSELGNATQSEEFKRLLINRYPESPFAEIFSRRGDVHEELQHQKTGNQIYQMAYDAFEAQNYQDVLDKWKVIDTLSLSNNLRAQFDYLKVLALHQLGRQQAALDLLGEVLVNYEGTLVHPHAQILYEVLKQRPTDKTPELQALDTTPVPADFQSVFTFNPGQVHFYIFVVDTRTVDPAAVMRELEILNNDQFLENRLTISNIYFRQNEHLIAVTSFPDKESALIYFRKASELPTLRNFSTQNAEAFIISIDNYPVFYQQKDVAGYMRFFRLKYF